MVAGGRGRRSSRDERTAWPRVAGWLRRRRILDRRSSRPHRAPHRSARRTPAPALAEIARLRRLRKTSSAIAAVSQTVLSTVGAVLARLKLDRLSELEPIEPVRRYQRDNAGDLLHVDIEALVGSPALGNGSWATPRPPHPPCRLGGSPRRSRRRHPQHLRRSPARPTRRHHSQVLTRAVARLDQLPQQPATSRRPRSPSPDAISSLNNPTGNTPSWYLAVAQVQSSRSPRHTVPSLLSVGH